MALSLMLGVFVGVGLLTLPALVTPTTTQADSRDNGTNNLLALNMKPAPTMSAQGSMPAETGPDRLGFVIRLFVVLLPASFLAIIARRWATRKLADYWYY